MHVVNITIGFMYSLMWDKKNYENISTMRAGSEKGETFLQAKISSHTVYYTKNNNNYYINSTVVLLTSIPNMFINLIHHPVPAVNHSCINGCPEVLPARLTRSGSFQPLSNHLPQAVSACVWFAAVVHLYLCRCALLKLWVQVWGYELPVSGHWLKESQQNWEILVGQDNLWIKDAIIIMIMRSVTSSECCSWVGFTSGEGWWIGNYILGQYQALS